MSKVNKRGADLLSTLEESMSEAGKKRKALCESTKKSSSFQLTVDTTLLCLLTQGGG